MSTSHSQQPAARRIGAMTMTVKSDLEIEFSREFDAPRRLVFEAHAKAEHLRRWWGPRGSTMAVCELDFRAGGKWRFVIRTARGHEVAFHGAYQEIRPPEEFVWTFAELCNGEIREDSRRFYLDLIERLRADRCDAVVLGCTEIPLLVSPEASPLPVLASTRLLARASVEVALGRRPLPSWRGGPAER